LLTTAIFLAFHFLPAITDNNKNSPTASGPLPNGGRNTPDGPVPTAELLGFEGGNIGAGGLVCGGDDGYLALRSL
jgi:hypothetical protein